MSLFRPLFQLLVPFGRFGVCLSALVYSGSVLGQPAAPPHLEIWGITTTKMVLYWVDEATDETEYRVERAESLADPYIEIATPDENSEGYTDSTLLAGRSGYYYRVRAYRESDGPASARLPESS